MNRQDFNAWDDRIRARAERLWEDAGRPEGSRNLFVDEARELVAIEEVELPTLDPEDAARPIIEEASIQRNLGEFPTLRDQGDEQTYPDDPPELTDDGEIRLSDGDASETGGVLPVDEVPDDDYPEASLADADITSSALDADDGPLNEDLNDDGMPDPTDLDAKGQMEDGNEDEDAVVGDDEDDDENDDEDDDEDDDDEEDDDVEPDDPDADDDLNP